MVQTAIRSSQDGPRISVPALMKTPTIIPRRLIALLGQAFLVNAVLRDVGQNTSGIVMFYESTPLFADEDPAIVSEFGEIPVTNGTLGTPVVRKTVRRARGLRVSKTMITRNSVDMVNTQLTQIRNTMIRAWEDALFQALVNNPSVQTMTPDKTWDDPLSHLRRDITAAKFLVNNAALPGQPDQKLLYRADTLLISTASEEDLLSSPEMASVYQGDLASENIQYTGKLPNKFLELDVISSWRLDKYLFGAAVVCQRNVVGGYSDERALEATPMYPEGNGPNGGPTESWRTDVTRETALAVDNPLAACIIHGIHT